MEESLFGIIRNLINRSRFEYIIHIINKKLEIGILRMIQIRTVFYSSFNFQNTLGLPRSPLFLENFSTNFCFCNFTKLS